MTSPLTKALGGLAVWLALSSLVHSAEPVLLKLKPPEEPVYAGQNVGFTVQLLTTTNFASVPVFQLPRLSGCLVLPPADRPLIGTETVDDTDYASQIHELRFIAIRPGRYQIPAFDVRFESPPEFAKPAIERRLRTTPMTIEAKSPPGAEKYRSILCSRGLKLTETWEPELPKTASVGDTFTRTVTLEAGDMPAMLLPPIPLTAPTGMKVYDDPPDVADHTERGVTTSHRRERVTYVCESGGSFELPGIVLPWWNLDSSTLEQATLPGAKFTVDAVVAPQDAASRGLDRKSQHRWWSVVVLAFLGCAVVVASSLFIRRQRGRADDAHVRFRLLMECCRQSDAPAALTALYGWLDLVGPKNQLSTLSVTSADPDLRQLVDEMETAAVLGSPWDGSPLARRLRLLPDTLANTSSSGTHLLPELNPTA
ncbi:hypothetical protein Pan44_46110 [Caulifigura coniformis]|uniref:DUF7939 domain-containing protein n=1 Tax=Caulifigura coniformis TaxID=2527983 RepID=A0A517SK98_9PLAN|nr:BatD family protein [Caulifigura coniformis]QDT56555.1 hypothetical protein Pan44_46110 [Caulifigura coniformis]